MLARRGRPGRSGLVDGPGKLCQALGVDRAIDGTRIRGSSLELVRGELVGAVEITPRIGITKAADWPLRFVVPSASGAARAAPLVPPTSSRG